MPLKWDRNSPKSGAEMKKHREALGFTLEQVAEKMWINKSTLHRWETGKVGWGRIHQVWKDEWMRAFAGCVKEQFLEKVKSAARKR